LPLLSTGSTPVKVGKGEGQGEENGSDARADVKEEGGQTSTPMEEASNGQSTLHSHSSAPASAIEEAVAADSESPFSSLSRLQRYVPRSCMLFYGMSFSSAVDHGLHSSPLRETPSAGVTIALLQRCQYMRRRFKSPLMQALMSMQR